MDTVYYIQYIHINMYVIIKRKIYFENTFCVVFHKLTNSIDAKSIQTWIVFFFLFRFLLSFSLFSLFYSLLSLSLFLSGSCSLFLSALIFHYPLTLVLFFIYSIYCFPNSMYSSPWMKMIEKRKENLMTVNQIQSLIRWYFLINTYII